MLYNRVADPVGEGQGLFWPCGGSANLENGLVLYLEAEPF